MVYFFPAWGWRYLVLCWNDFGLQCFLILIRPEWGCDLALSNRFCRVRSIPSQHLVPNIISSNTVIARSALYVRGIVKIGCSVCRSFVRSFVRSCQISMIFTEKKVGGKQMPPSSEVLKHRFWNFLQKRVEVLLSKQNEKYFDRFLDHFFELFWKKLKLHIFHLSRFALVPCAVYLLINLSYTLSGAICGSVDFDYIIRYFSFAYYVVLWNSPSTWHGLYWHFIIQTRYTAHGTSTKRLGWKMWSFNFFKKVPKKWSKNRSQHMFHFAFIATLRSFFCKTFWNRGFKTSLLRRHLTTPPHSFR